MTDCSTYLDVESFFCDDGVKLDCHLGSKLLYVLHIVSLLAVALEARGLGVGHTAGGFGHGLATLA